MRSGVRLPRTSALTVPSAWAQMPRAVLENRPDSLYGVTPQVGWLLGQVVGMGKLSCQDTLKHTFCVALGVDRTSGNIVHPCRVNLFEKPCPRLWTTQEHRDLFIDKSIQ